MLPPDPPKLSGRDFDPANMPEEDVNMDAAEEEDGGGLGSGVEMSSVEINILIYLYLLESNFPHTAFTLLSESNLPSTSLFQHFHPSFPTSSNVSRGKTNGPTDTPANNKNGNGNSPMTATFGTLDGRIPRGELVRKLWKGVRWEEVERHVNKHGDPFKPQCPNPFHLLIPHTCPSSYPSSSQNPSLPLPSAMRISPPPRRTEAFPPPSREGGSESEAGPSRPRSSRSGNGADAAANERLGLNGIGIAGKVKRRSRRNSTESENRQASPARSSTTATGVGGGGAGKARSERGEAGSKKEGEKGEKKRARISGDGVEGAKSREKAKGKERAEVDGMDMGNEDPAAPMSAVSTVPRIRIANGDISRDKTPASTWEDSPVEKKRKRDKDKDKEDLIPPPANSTNTAAGDRRSKSPSGSSGNTPSRRTRDLPPEPPKPKRGAGNPLWISDESISIFTGHKDSVTCLGWNPSNPLLLASGAADGFARLWEFDPPSPSSSSASSASAPPVALTSSIASIPVKHTSIDSSRRVTALTWHPEGSIMATASADGVGRIFTPGGQLQGIMSYGRGQLNAMKFSPEGRSVLTAKNDFVVSLWTVGKGYAQMLNRSYDAHTKEVNDIDWLDDHVFATAGNDHTIFVFRTADKVVRYTLKGHTDDVTRIRWSPAPDTPSSSTATTSMKNRLLASVSDDGYAMVWKLPGYPPNRVTPRRSVSPSKTGSAGTPGASGGGGGGNGMKEDEDYFEGQGRKGKEGIEYCVAKLLVVEGENKRLNTLEWSPACKDGRMLLAAGAQDSTVKIFDVTTGQLLHDLKGPESGTASLTFAPFCTPGFPLGAIAAGGWTGQLGIWDVESGEKRGEWEVENASGKGGHGVLALAWRDDGKQLALGLQSKSIVTIATDLEGMAKRAGGGRGKAKQVGKVEQ